MRKCFENLERHTYAAQTIEEAIKINESGGGFIKAMWCGGAACEEGMKQKAGLSSRCIPFKQDEIGKKCVVCGGAAHQMVLWAVAY